MAYTKNFSQNENSENLSIFEAKSQVVVFYHFVQWTVVDVTL